MECVIAGRKWRWRKCLVLKPPIKLRGRFGLQLPPTNANAKEKRNRPLHFGKWKVTDATASNGSSGREQGNGKVRVVTVQSACSGQLLALSNGRSVEAMVAVMGHVVSSSSVLRCATNLGDLQIDSG